MPPTTLAQVEATQVLAPYMSVFFLAFLVSLVATPLMRSLALANGIVDVPDLLRKNHREPIAYLGGVAIFIGWLIGILGCNFVVPHTFDVPDGGITVEFPISIVIGGIAIVMTGMLDDIYGISPRLKIGGQLFAAAGLALDDIGHRFVENSLGLLGLGFVPEVVVYCLGTVLLAFLVVAGCNAVNLIDGLDGLAAGVCAIATLGFLAVATLVAVNALGNADIAVASLATDPIRIVMCLAVVGAILGFLPYNFNPATIFMGDAGSLLLGFFGVTSILLFADTGGAALKLGIACLIIFGVPITDTSLAIIRRKMRGKPIFSPDNEHLHHLLRRSGYTVRQSVGILYAVAVGFAVIGVGMVAMDLELRYVLAVFAVIYAFIFVTMYKVARNLAARDRVIAPPPAPGPATLPDTAAPDAEPPADGPLVAATNGNGHGNGNGHAAPPASSETGSPGR
ncbi:MAG: MraY family glycosyltransferase [Planctomycetota bacterium]